MFAEYEITRDDHVAFNMDALSTKTFEAPQRRILALLVAFPIVLGLIDGFVTGDWISGPILGILFSALIWFAYPPINRWFQKRTIHKALASSDYSLGGSTRLTINEQGITEDIPGQSTFRSWNRLDRISETDTHAFVYAGPVEAFIIPKNNPQTLQVIEEIKLHIAAQAINAAQSLN